MSRQGRPVTASWLRMAAASLMPLLLLGCSFVTTPGAQAQVARDQAVASLRLDHLVSGYQAGGSLGFQLRDTAVDEQLYHRMAGAERALVWSAQFVSRWPLNADQLDRWSAQAIGLLADGLGADVRLAGYERLDANDVGDQRVAYRYALATPTGQPLGEATIVVFARGEQVGLTGTAAVGTAAPIDASSLARVLDGRGS